MKRLAWFTRRYWLYNWPNWLLAVSWTAIAFYSGTPLVALAVPFFYGVARLRWWTDDRERARSARVKAERAAELERTKMERTEPWTLP